VEHVVGEEKYECEMLNVFVMVSRRFCGRVCCDAFSGSFFGILELHLWYSHIISVSNDCGGGTRLCVLYLSMLYCCHNHFSLVVGMVVRCLPVFSYICVNSCCIYI
jgi:hypothetical protein